MKLTPQQLLDMKGRQRINSLTCYDYQMALWMNETNIHFVLVGDSLAEVIYGHQNTHEVSMQTMEAHVAAVVKGAKNKHVIADMPAGSYNNPSQAYANAKRLITLGASSVKLENPNTEVVKTLVNSKIAVCGHVGLTPQTATKYGQTGKTTSEANAIIADAARLTSAGIFMIVLEAINEKTSTAITKSIAVPTIGIASGENNNCCDGKILVIYDLLGITKKLPPFVKNPNNFGTKLKDIVDQYCKT